MKKRVLIVLTMILMALFATACTTTPRQEESEPEKIIEELNDTVEQTEEKEDEETLLGAEYDDTLAKVYDFITKVGEVEEVEDGFNGIWSAALALRDKALEEIGFVFKDVNGDGIDELMIGSFNKADDAYTNNEIYALYTLKDGNPELLLEGRSRSMYSLKDDNSFFFQGSNGAAYSIFGNYHVDANGELICDDYYFTSPDENDPAVINIYHNKTGVYSESESEKSDLTIDDFVQLEKEASEGTAKIEATPFATLNENN